MTSASTPNHHQPSTSAAEFTATSTTASNVDPNTHLATSGYAPSENQLAGLVEAATAAAGQDVSEWAAAAAVAAAAGAAGNTHHLEGYGPDIHMDDDSFADTSFTAGINGGRALRGPGSAPVNEHAQNSGLTRVGTKKRKRNEDALDPALTGGGHVGLAGDQQSHHHSHHPQQQQQQQQHPHHYGGDGLDLRGAPPQSLSEARAVGLHSAAALFRQPSSNKKYTRPPMSKLFSSLELSPENFLHLQAAAKAYMLDDRHPERRDCVGQRGKGDTEMVKLRLWNCVRHFLEGEGHGERFFGEDVVNEGMGPRAYIWPRDQQKIISLVIPLLRRMVTNERQRQYAVETRKGGGAEERRRRKTEDSLQNFNAHTPTEDHLQLHSQHQHQQQQQQHHQIHDDYTAMQTPMSASQPPMGSTSQAVDLGLTELLLDGYTTDWNAFAKSYDNYNQNCELDNLWYLSGLQQPDWRGLVAAVDSHYQVIHNGGYECPPQCEDDNIQRILEANVTSDLRWRIGGNIPQPARNEFASSITRDVSRIIRDNLAVKHEPHATSHDQTSVSQPQHFPPSNLPPIPGAASAASNVRPPSSPMSVSLRINLIQDGKRTHSRLDLPGSQCPDLETLKQVIFRRFSGQLPGLSSEPGLDSASGWVAGINWKFKVWLPDGLATVQNDGDWTIALLSAGNVDWMDGDLRVLVEFEEAS